MSYIGHEQAGGGDAYVQAFAELARQVRDVPPTTVAWNDATRDACEKGWLPSCD